MSTDIDNLRIFEQACKLKRDASERGLRYREIAERFDFLLEAVATLALRKPGESSTSLKFHDSGVEIKTAHSPRNQPWQPDVLVPYLQLRRNEFGDAWRHISSTLTLSIGKDGNWLLNTGEYPRVAKFTGTVYGADSGGERIPTKVTGDIAKSYRYLYIERSSAGGQRRARQTLGHQLNPEHAGLLFRLT
jgi:hypothetical protein